ncbi:MAG: response regulator transcription factor [Bacteroidetes bacterium]|nr:response regulator transcription factor [Bacteroidota bacterium]
MKESNCIKVLLADDHQLFRSGIISLLKKEDEIYIVDEAENGEELIAKYFEKTPDIILSDISMPTLSGTEAIMKIRERDKSAKVLFLSMYDTEEYIYYSIKAGGLGLVSKNILRKELIKAIKIVNKGRRYFGNMWSEKNLSDLLNRYDSILTPQIYYNNSSLSLREVEILKFISEGFTSKEIANKLKLSKRTIDTYRTNLMQKLFLKTLPELIRFAIQFTMNNGNKNFPDYVLK